MSKDTNPHPSVQPWSRGPIFPAVIARVEHHITVWGHDLYTIQWELSYPGMEPQRYNTYDDAAQQARGLNRAKVMREQTAVYSLAAPLKPVTTVGWGNCIATDGKTDTLHTSLPNTAYPSITAAEVKAKTDAYWQQMADVINSVVPRKELDKAKAEVAALKEARSNDARLMTDAANTAARATQNEVIVRRHLDEANKMLSAVRMERDSVCKSAAAAKEDLAGVTAELDVTRGKLRKLHAAVGRLPWNVGGDDLDNAWNRTAP